MAGLLRLLVSALALMITAYLVPGFIVEGFVAALFAALIVGIANAVIRPILIILTLPLNILTLGLFTFVVNAMVLKLCAMFVPGFSIRSFGTAVIGAIILAIVGSLLHMIAV